MNRVGVVLAVTLFLWASAFVGIRVAIEHYSPGALALFRFLVASILLTSYMVASGRGASLRRATRPDWLGVRGTGTAARTRSDAAARGRREFVSHWRRFQIVTT